MEKVVGFQKRIGADGNLAVARLMSVPRFPASMIDADYVERWAKPRAGLPDEINRWRKDNQENLYRPSPTYKGGPRTGLSRIDKILKATELGAPHFYGSLGLTVLRGARFDLELFEKYDIREVIGYEEALLYGLASAAVVTDAGVGHLVDAYTNAVEAETMNFHGIGTGTRTEDVTETALETELTTQYNPDNTRATGTQSQPSANIYRTVGTNAVDATVAITEHMILSQAAVGGGVGLDRSLFAAINLTSGDSLQSTYSLTVNSGG